MTTLPTQELQTQTVPDPTDARALLARLRSVALEEYRLGRDFARHHDRIRALRAEYARLLDLHVSGPDGWTSGRTLVTLGSETRRRETA